MQITCRNNNDAISYIAHTPAPHTPCSALGIGTYAVGIVLLQMLPRLYVSDDPRAYSRHLAHTVRKMIEQNHITCLTLLTDLAVQARADSDWVWDVARFYGL